MIQIDIRQLSVAFGTNVILKDITLTVHKGEHVGLIGANGAGKTTLFNALLGKLPSESGAISMPKGLSLGYLSQHHDLSGSHTVLEEAFSVFEHVFAMERQMQLLEHEMALHTENEDALQAINEQYIRLTEQYEKLDGYSVKSRTLGVLRGLGLKDAFFDRKIDTLSGGERTRLAIARLLLENHDVLLLDEPTNHLDLSAVEWLTDFLSASPATIFIISHDRYLLDRLCNVIAEIENRQLVSYRGNYTQYRQKRDEAKRIMQKQYDEQQKEIARQKEIIERYRSFNREKSIRAAESREKALERMDKVDAPEYTDNMRLEFKTAGRTGTEVLKITGLSKAFEDQSILNNTDLFVKAGQRIAILGPNGAGKTTFFKMLLGRLPYEGEIKWGAGTDIGYYAQQQENLTLTNPILDEIWTADRNLTQTQVRNVAAAMLFKNEDVFKPVSMLSGGERARVALCKLSLGGHNVLLMDEPTNHLDMDSREVLEDALLGFSGTLLVVSHDRYFINKLADTVWVLEDRTLTEYKGNYDAYINSRKAQTQEAVVPELTKTQLDRQKKKERLAKEETKQKKQLLLKTEKEINRTEEQLRQIEALFSNASTYEHTDKINELNTQYKCLKSKLDTLYQSWEALSENPDA